MAAPWYATPRGRTHMAKATAPPGTRRVLATALALAVLAASACRRTAGPGGVATPSPSPAAAAAARSEHGLLFDETGEAAGLRHATTFGNEKDMRYIVETTG